MSSSKTPLPARSATLFTKSTRASPPSRLRVSKRWARTPAQSGSSPLIRRVARSWGRSNSRLWQRWERGSCISPRDPSAFISLEGLDASSRGSHVTEDSRDDDAVLPAAQTGEPDGGAAVARLRLGGMYDQDPGARILLCAAAGARWRELLERVRHGPAAGVVVAADQDQQSDCRDRAGVLWHQHVLPGLPDRKIHFPAAIPRHHRDRQWSRLADVGISRARISPLLSADHRRDARAGVDERVAAGARRGRATLAGTGWS